MSYDIIEGDLEPDMPMSVGVSVVGASSVRMRWRKPSGAVSTVDLTIITAASGELRRVWEAGDTDEVGVHRCQVVVTWSTGEVQTFPSDGNYGQWTVHPKLA